MERTNAWIAALLRDKGIDIYRMKGEMQPRCSRDAAAERAAAEVQPRCSRGAAEVQPRCSRGVAEVASRRVKVAR